MKQIFIILICTSVLFSLISCSNKDIKNDNANTLSFEEQQAYDVGGYVLKKIKKQYPDADITPNGSKYEVISENIDFSNITEISSAGVADAPVYSSLDEFYETLSPQRNIIFVGKKTGESRQYLPISAETGTVSGLYYTNSKVEVTKAFYGDVQTGDVITYKEFYAVFTDDDGNQQLLHTAPLPPKTGECLFVLSTNGSDSLYGDIQYHDSIVNMGCLDTSEMYELYTDENGFEVNDVAAELYTKYVINNDVSLNRYQLIKAAVKYKSTITENLSGESSEQDKMQTYDALLADENTTLEEFNSVLDKQELELIEKLLKQYGEKNSSHVTK